MNGLASLGVPLITTDQYPDGDLLVIDDSMGRGRPTMFLLGTGPVDEKTWCRREAAVIVHQGLADVLEWLGWPKTTGHPSSAGVLASLRSGGMR